MDDLYIPPLMVQDIQRNGPLLLKAEETVPISRDDSDCGCALSWEEDKEKVTFHICDGHRSDRKAARENFRIYIETVANRIEDDRERSVPELRRMADNLRDSIMYRRKEVVIPLREKRDNLHHLAEVLPTTTLDDVTVSFEVFGSTIRGPPDTTMHTLIEDARDRVDERLAIHETQLDDLETSFHRVQDRIRELRPNVERQSLEGED